ncbi:aminodeoxychorismate synthase component I [Sinomonas terrae]|uniref:aminodeoxychorismate synthase n=1 Tax=Sinomonas terrae TaxID=2908838 RepID=A0ABS9TX58_9MICC|nr:aminodeoxychorismate synthase component I [Sinomonas terrae]MCH6468950.1 aminodeoxychorismate synthase component I [Sinomonas terrae]
MTRQHVAHSSVIAVDGRSGAGKTSLAVELVAALREHRTVALVHLEDLYPGWDGLARGIERCATDILAPLRRGETARWRAWDWLTGDEGEERVTEPAEIVVLEGVGAGAEQLRGLADAVVWLESPADERRRRALDRDGETYAPHWERWAAQEDAWLAADDVAAAATVTVVSSPGAARSEQATRRVLDALAELPAFRDALAPERAQRESPEVVVRRIAAAPEPVALFETLFGGSEHAIWLDSSDRPDSDRAEGPNARPPSTRTRSRFSIMADDGGLLGRRAVHSDGVTSVTYGPETPSPATARFDQPFFRWLDSAWGHSGEAPPEGLECGFALGWLGYLGYELKRECGGNNVSTASPPDSGIPDAQLVYAARAVVVDHDRGGVWLLALAAPDAASWLDEAERAVRAPAAEASDTPLELAPAPAFRARDDGGTYRDKVRAAKAEITEGTTYEVCLTTALEADIAPDQLDPWATYRSLRRRSPAPFAAFARFGSVAIASTSPERFLSITDDGGLRAEPIKGTRRRSAGAGPEEDALVRAELAGNPKDRAENLMIVDLLRNDLSHFAVPGSVAVARLFAVETYATVHQLVSTIEAQLRPGASRAEAVAAAFPPGSMTGAPKISTMDILDRLEGVPRGVYSGAIGYFSRTGAADLSVVIRTLVVVERPDGTARLSLGVGGAVVADSDPDAEHDEIRAKSFAVLSTLSAQFPK